MALTTTQLATRCAERYGDPTHRIVTEATWLEYLNEAYQEINAVQRDWPWNRESGQYVVTTAANTQAYTINGTGETYSVDSVWDDTNQIRLKPVQFGPGGFLDMWGQPLVVAATADDPGQPLYYRMLGSQIIFYPQPDGVYSIIVEAVNSPADLDLSTSNPVWPNRYRRALIELALSRAYLDDGNSQWADAHRKTGEDIVTGMVSDLIGRPLIEAYPGVVDDWYA